MSVCVYTCRRGSECLPLCVYYLIWLKGDVVLFPRFRLDLWSHSNDAFPLLSVLSLLLEFQAQSSNWPPGALCVKHARTPRIAYY